MTHLMQILMRLVKNYRKKAEMIFSANIDRHKSNLLVYAKYWKRVCLPSLLFGSGIFTLTPTSID